MRSGNWKYLRDENTELVFDLAADEREQADFAEAEPNRLKSMRDAFAMWESQMSQYRK